MSEESVAYKNNDLQRRGSSSSVSAVHAGTSHEMESRPPGLSISGDLYDAIHRFGVGTGIVRIAMCHYS